MTKNNANLANIFHRMASVYRYKQDRFRAVAYETASRTLKDLNKDISAYLYGHSESEELKGVGEGMREKIREYLETGKISAYEKIKDEVSEGLLELMDVSGLGPATVKELHQKLKINNPVDLTRKIEKGKLRGVHGFGAKKIETIKQGLKFSRTTHDRMLLWNAMEAGRRILRQIKKIHDVEVAELAGSLRRKKETIGDINIIVAANKKKWKTIIKKITDLPEVESVAAKHETRGTILLQTLNAQVDIRLVQEDEYGAAMLHATGSKQHVTHLKSLARQNGWKMNGFGVFDAKSNRKLAGNTEREIYQLFGMEFIPPELREERGEIQWAQKKSFPKLIELKDIKGDLHMHSTWSDGTADIESISNYIRKEKPGYEYIVITDHSPSQKISGGVSIADFKKQFAEIDRINKRAGDVLVKKGVEVNILADGSLDLSDALLKKFDWVVASVHTGFNKNNTERLLKACENPYVCCIGHPSGRKLNIRDAYAVDWAKLFDKAAETGTAIEINAQANRLDLTDQHVKEAIEKGVMVVINTDAHKLSHFDFMELGIAVARRGWCTKSNILNSLSWSEIEKRKKKPNSA